MTSYLLLAGLTAGALGRRFAGGLLSAWAGRDLGILGPLAWGVLLAAALAPTGWPALLALWFPIGLRVRGNTPGSVLALLGHGLVVALPPAVALGVLGRPWWALALAGALCPAIYAAAFRWPLNVPVLGCLTRDPPPTAELVWGGMLGAALAMGVA